MSQRYTFRQSSGGRALAWLLLAIVAIAVSSAGSVSAAADAPASPAGPNTPKAGAARGAEKPAAKQSPSNKPGGKQSSPALADELLEDKSASDLDNQLLEGAPPARRPMDKPPSGPPAGSPPAGKAADDSPDRGGAPAPAAQPDAGVEQPSATDNPLAYIGEQMRAAQHRLESLRQSDADTKELQDKIVVELAALIAQLEKQQSSQQPSSNDKRRPQSSPSERKSVRQPGANSTDGRADDKRPAKESNERANSGEKAPPTADQLRGLMKDVWGQLPAREREQMLQSPPEQFLPKYELLLEKYYKRLAEEQKRRP